ncbi:cyclophilin 13 / CyP13 [Leishmania donovani]|uniref:Cyclophilin type peptidyl-prolyl cis-trans isomerase/CLD family protein n=2 Tax=Leishmania donovani TaxID=5661 RepID=A0A504WZ51_LEIDO|nr:cyclophilin, putative [Leishmania donovani]TPP41008.1 Cyclophilin type peptidyl-prolyl cis-trans isomerase/CLD family protein [Leishmania donovani]TPP51125.1 Cyclophilin type peptidyl-prolyl cis-trans isomerase/CLD family protein [Leishmania donovani]CAJ1987714.1 cyclophilin 13 / CyP13 [Leishmania donovani]CBZ33105.1 cyclophilin, putative [Leishmania donovani]VDZ43601.1 cyclophilin_13_putative/GeneDB:LmjF.16.1200 [Leishmania donovani]
MNPLSTRRLGGIATPGSALSGTCYVSHTTRPARTMCWMKLAVFTQFPVVPSLAGTQVQGRQDLLASTAGAGTPEETSLFLQIELFDDECPQLCANFRRLCNGQSTTRQGQVYCYQGLTPSYCGTYFHKIIPSYCVQGGDITMRVKPGGTNSYSSAGRTWLPDEFKKRRHNEIGLVSMANNGPNSNGSQFFITTSAAHERAFNGRHCCIGRVVHGLDAFIALVAPFGNVEGHPSKYAVVVDCGEGEAPTLMSASSSPAAVSQASMAISETETARSSPAADTRSATVEEAPAELDIHYREQPPQLQLQHHQAADGTGVMAALSPSGAAAAAAPPSISPAQPLKSSLKGKTTAASEAAKTHAKHVTYQL